MLIAQIHVSCDQHVKAGSFCGGEQLSIDERGPTTFERSLHVMEREGTSQRSGCALVKQDAHLAGRYGAASRVFQYSAHLLSSNSRKPFDEVMSLRIVPRFSKGAAMGTRVPRNS